LCTSAAPADKFLFGGDTSKRVKEISELSKSRLCKSQAPRGKGKRYSPYPSRNYRGTLLEIINAVIFSNNSEKTDTVQLNLDKQ